MTLSLPGKTPRTRMVGSGVSSCQRTRTGETLTRCGSIPFVLSLYPCSLPSNNPLAEADVNRHRRDVRSFPDSPTGRQPAPSVADYRRHRLDPPTVLPSLNLDTPRSLGEQLTRRCQASC